MPLKFIPTNVKYNDSGEFKNISIPADRAYMNEAITISSTQPTNSDNKLWINTNEQTKQTYQIPTMTEMEAADNAILGNLATIESSPATAAHAVGEYIVYNGQLYKVTAAIASEQTLTPGINISAVNDGGLNSLGAYVNENFAPYYQINVTGYSSYKMTLPSLSGHFIFIVSSSLSRSAILYIVVQASGDVAVEEIQKGNNFTYTVGTNEVTFSTGATYAVYIKEIPIRGNPITVEPVE